MVASAAAPTEAELSPELIQAVDALEGLPDARSGDLLSRLAEEALAEHRAGLTQDLDPDRE